MSLLNLENKRRSRSRTPLKVILGIGALATVLTLAQTLAANININSGPVEFGQGVAQTTSCDQDGLTVTPLSTFVTSGDGYFNFTGIGLTDISSNCLGTDFLISAYPDTGSALELDSGGATVARITFDGASTDTVTSGKTGTSYFDGGIADATSTGFTLVLASSPNRATDVYKITLETQAHDTTVSYAIGDTGPAGGIAGRGRQAGQPQSKQQRRGRPAAGIRHAGRRGAVHAQGHAGGRQRHPGGGFEPADPV